MYPPRPVSMQVALPAQGLDEHRRVSVVKEKNKINKKRFGFQSVRSPSSASFHVSELVFSSCLHFQALARVHTTASCHRVEN